MCIMCVASGLPAATLLPGVALSMGYLAKDKALAAGSVASSRARQAITGAMKRKTRHDRPIQLVKSKS